MVGKLDLKDTEIKRRDEVYTHTHARTPAHTNTNTHSLTYIITQELLRSQNAVRVKEEELHVKEVRRCCVLSSHRALCMCARTCVRMCLLVYSCVRAFPLHDGE